MTEVLNLIVILLLIVAIIYGYVLNKKIMLIKDSKKDLANLFKGFDKTILRAQASIDSLKEVSNHASQELQARIDKSAILIDDLSFIIEKAERVLDDADNKKILKNNSQNLSNNAVDPEQIKQIKKTISNEKKLKQSNKKVAALESLLEKISSSKNLDNDERNKPIKAANINNKNDMSNKDKIADALRQLGFGD